MPRRPSSSNTNFAGGNCSWYVQIGQVFVVQIELGARRRSAPCSLPSTRPPCRRRASNGCAFVFDAASRIGARTPAPVATSRGNDVACRSRGSNRGSSASRIERRRETPRRTRRCPSARARAPGGRASAADFAGFSSKRGDAMIRHRRHHAELRAPRRAALRRTPIVMSAPLSMWSAIMRRSPSCRRDRRRAPARTRAHAARRMSRFWYTASAVPRYQSRRTRCCAGTISMNSPKRPSRKPQPRCTCRIRLCALYCVQMPMRRMPELTQLDSEKSMIRNLPPNGTAGFARQSVSCGQPRAAAAGHHDARLCLRASCSTAPDSSARRTRARAVEAVSL